MAMCERPVSGRGLFLSLLAGPDLRVVVSETLNKIIKCERWIENSNGSKQMELKHLKYLS